MHFFPFRYWWNEVNALTLKADLQAGLVGAVVVLPQSVAFATIAGMPPEYGLFTGMVPAIIAALLALPFTLSQARQLQPRWFSSLRLASWPSLAPRSTYSSH